jgi:hypothetical protein
MIILYFDEFGVVMVMFSGGTIVELGVFDRF